MLPLIQREVVEKEHWVTETEIVDIFAISQSVPGVIAINSAIFIGNRVAGVAGAVSAAFGVIFPAFASIMAILLALMSLRENIYVEKVFAGIRAASAGLILLAAFKLGKSVIKNRSSWWIAGVSFAGIVLFNLNAAWMVIFGGAAGYVIYRWQRRKSS